MNNFADRLTELMEKATNGPLCVKPSETEIYIAKLYGPHNTVSDDILQWDAELIAYIVNNAPAIRDLVLAAEKLAGPYVRGMQDSDPHKGSLNYLADALAKLEEL